MPPFGHKTHSILILAPSQLMSVAWTIFKRKQLHRCKLVKWSSVIFKINSASMRCQAFPSSSSWCRGEKKWLIAISREFATKKIRVLDDLRATWWWCALFFVWCENFFSFPSQLCKSWWGKCVWMKMLYRDSHFCLFFHIFGFIDTSKISIFRWK